MLTNLACTISNLRGEWDYTMVQRLPHRQTRSQGTEGWKDASENNKCMIVQCATFSESLNPRNIDKSGSDIRIRIRFPFESSFWISGSSCKLTILLDIQPANRIVIISAIYIYVSQMNRNRMSTMWDLYCCLLPQCEALHTCRLGFPIATKWCFD